MNKNARMFIRAFFIFFPSLNSIYQKISHRAVI